MNNAIIHLSHGQQVVVPSFKYQNKIELVTPSGYALKHGDCPKEAEEQATKNGWEFLACFKHCTVISADYEGKAEKLAKEYKEWEEAQRIEEGDIVKCEGRKYTVKVLSENVSNPVKFIPVN
jgi:hypothetical protein